jgi:nitrate/nitrite-specific signal transduction histidine kinase
MLDAMEREPARSDRAERARALRRLRWGAVVWPTLFIFWSETVRHRFFDDVPTWLGNLITASVALAGALLFAHLFFRMIEQIDARLIARNERLATLHALATIANTARDEASLLDASLPVIRDALRCAEAAFVPDSGHVPSAGAAYPLVHNGTLLGTLLLKGYVISPEPATIEAVRETLAIGIANRRLATENARLAILEERDRIARELHDGLAQTLAAIGMQSERVRGALAEGNGAAARVAVEHIERASEAAYSDVREAIVGLRTGSVGDFRAALAETAEWFEDTTGIAVTVGFALDDARALSPLAELQLLRIVQESLTNVRKHAGASRVWIALAPDEEIGIRLAVRDDGMGFDPDAAPRHGRQHFGLLIMRERAESLGGTLAITAAPGTGTPITVTLPALAADARGAA